MAKTTKKEVMKQQKVWYAVDRLDNLTGNLDDEVSIRDTLEEAYNECRENFPDEPKLYAYKITSLGPVKQKIEIVK